MIIIILCTCTYCTRCTGGTRDVDRLILIHHHRSCTSNCLSLRVIFPFLTFPQSCQPMPSPLSSLQIIPLLKKPSPLSLPPLTTPVLLTISSLPVFMPLVPLKTSTIFSTSSPHTSLPLPLSPLFSPLQPRIPQLSNLSLASLAPSPFTTSPPSPTRVAPSVLQQLSQIFSTQTSRPWTTGLLSGSASCWRIFICVFTTSVRLPP